MCKQEDSVQFVDEEKNTRVGYYNSVLFNHRQNTDLNLKDLSVFIF